VNTAPLPALQKLTRQNQIPAKRDPELITAENALKPSLLQRSKAALTLKNPEKKSRDN
jgi:hypothetical protein